MTAASVDDGSSKVVTGALATGWLMIGALVTTGVATGWIGCGGKVTRRPTATLVGFGMRRDDLGGVLAGCCSLGWVETGADEAALTGAADASLISDAVGNTPRWTAAAFCSGVRFGRIAKNGSIRAADPGIAVSIALRAP